MEQMEHRTKVVILDTGYAGRCTCKAKGPTRLSLTDAEDWGYQHLRDVERTRAHLRERAPSLRDQYDYYRQMQNNPDTPVREREQWKMLADGIQHRLGLPTQVEMLL